MPLASTFILSKKKGKEAYVEPVIGKGGYFFTVKAGRPPAVSGKGTTAGKRKAFLCLVSGVPVTYDYIRNEGQAGRMGTRLMAIVVEGERGRVYLAPTKEHETVSQEETPRWKPGAQLPSNPRDFKTPLYGMNSFAELFSDRQLVALTTFSDLVGEARERIRHDAVAAGLADDSVHLWENGIGATAYAEAVGIYLSFLVNQVANHSSTICGWNNVNAQMRSVFALQAIPMVWNFAESNPFSESSGSYVNLYERLLKGFGTLGFGQPGFATQADAIRGSVLAKKLISTDPPYYDNIGYADLSDFFYVWLRRTMRTVFPDLFGTIVVPKDDELVATPYRHGNRQEAEAFFLKGMKRALRRLAEDSQPGLPLSIFYAFKQSETQGGGVSSTGWETFLDAAVSIGLTITGTWPMRTERGGRALAIGANALASSIVLACRTRPANAAVATRREFVDALNEELPTSLRTMQAGNIAPVDLAQAAIGPGMAVFSRYERVLDVSGNPLSVREALSLINQTLEEALAEQEGDFDADTRWAVAWFEQQGFNQGEYGVAETLSKAKNTSVDGMIEAGILIAGGGTVRLLRPDELPDDWDPETDTRRTVWEMVHHLIRVHGQAGEGAAAVLLAKLRADAESARELAYRLYRICEQKNRAQEALGYNALVQSWPEIARLARERPRVEQAELIDGAGTTQ